RHLLPHHSTRLTCICHHPRSQHSFPTRRSSDLAQQDRFDIIHYHIDLIHHPLARQSLTPNVTTLHGRQDIPDLVPFYQEFLDQRSEEHTSELQSREKLVCRLLLEKKKKIT